MFSGAPDDPKTAGFMRALAAAFTGGAPGTEVVDPDGSVVRIEAPDAPGVERVMRGETEDGPYVLRVYNALAVMPNQYPAAYPFIPGVTFTIMEAAERSMIIWIGMGGAHELAEAAIKQSLADGWSEFEAAGEPELPQGRAFRKNGRRRSIAFSSAGPMGFATLWERSAADATS